MVAVLMVSILAMIGLVVDGGRALVARRVAMDDAAEAARSGADALSIYALRSGSVQLDPAGAVESAQRFLSQAGATGTVTIVGQTVIVQVTAKEPTVLLGLVGVHNISVSATSSATNVHGVTEGG